MKRKNRKYDPDSAAKNELIRPAVANIDQALVIFALENPTPNLTLLDRFLVMMEQQNVPTAICFNKEILRGRLHRPSAKRL